MFGAILSAVKDTANSVVGGAKGLSEAKTSRINSIRGWAGPIIFLLTALPFVCLLWGWFSSIFFKEASYVTENAVRIVQAIGPVYFFSVISILLTGTAGAAALTANKKMTLESEVRKEEQKTLQVAIQKGESGLKGFELAFQTALGHEGGYANDKDDKGGETYKGISRVNHGNWEGWRMIDREKTNKSKFPDCLKSNAKLDDAVHAFYKENFWLHYRIDKINEMSENVACEVFDSTVNAGYHGIKFLQLAINEVCVSRGLPVIEADGKMGGETLAALDSILPKYESQLLKLCNHYQANHYMLICQRDESQYKFLMGWLKRV